MVLLAGLQPSVAALLWLIDIAVRACCPGQVGAAVARLFVPAEAKRTIRENKIFNYVINGQSNGQYIL